VLKPLLADLPARMLRNPWLALAIVAGGVASLVLVAQIVYAQGGRLGTDFRVFWLAARAPLSTVYVPDPRAPFVYPPSALPWFKPLLLLAFWPSFIAWSIAGLTVYLLAARASWLLVISPVVVQCVVFGQTALLLGAVVLLAARKSGFIRGALIGAVFAIKPQLVALAPLVFALRRDWHDVIGFGAALTAMIALSLALFGPGMWVDWVHALPAFREVISHQRIWGLVVTPFSYAVQLGINPWPVFALCLVVATAAIWYSREREPVEIICLTSLLATPYAGGSDLAALLPFAFRRLIDAREPLKVWAALIYASGFTPIAVVLGLYRLCFLRDSAKGPATAR
jgi:hypothetical protein